MKVNRFVFLFMTILLSAAVFMQCAFAIGAPSDVDFRDETVYNIMVSRFHDGDPSNNITDTHGNVIPQENESFVIPSSDVTFSVSFIGTLFDVISQSVTDKKTIANINFPREGTYSVVFADYEDGRLVGVSVGTKEFTLGENEVPSKDGVMLSDDDTIMAIDTVKTLVPLGEAYRVTGD